MLFIGCNRCQGNRRQLSRFKWRGLFCMKLTEYGFTRGTPRASNISGINCNLWKFTEPRPKMTSLSTDSHCTFERSLGFLAMST